MAPARKVIQNQHSRGIDNRAHRMTWLPDWVADIGGIDWIELGIPVAVATADVTLIVAGMSATKRW